MSYGNYPDFSSIRKILVVKLRQLGDVLLSGPVFQVLRDNFPQARIDSLLYRDTLCMLEGHPGIDRFIGLERNSKRGPFWKRWGKEFSLLYKIRQEGYDLVIN